MNLKLKSNLYDQYIYIPFENRNVLGKFIDPALYRHLYKKHPQLFDVVVQTKKTKADDISINNTEHGSDSDSEREIA